MFADCYVFDDLYPDIIWDSFYKEFLYTTPHYLTNKSSMIGEERFYHIDIEKSHHFSMRTTDAIQHYAISNLVMYPLSVSDIYENYDIGMTRLHCNLQYASSNQDGAFHQDFTSKEIESLGKEEHTATVLAMVSPTVKKGSEFQYCSHKDQKIESVPFVRGRIVVLHNNCSHRGLAPIDPNDTGRITMAYKVIMREKKGKEL